MSDTIFCPNCGERISSRARFCPSCGARQEEYRVAPPVADPPSATAPTDGTPAAGVDDAPRAAAPPDRDDSSRAAAAPDVDDSPDDDVPSAAAPPDATDGDVADPGDASPKPAAPPRDAAPSPPAEPSARGGLWSAGDPDAPAPPSADSPPSRAADAPPSADSPPSRAADAPPSADSPPSRAADAPPSADSPPSRAADAPPPRDAGPDAAPPPDVARPDARPDREVAPDVTPLGAEPSRPAETPPRDAAPAVGVSPPDPTARPGDEPVRTQTGTTGDSARDEPKAPPREAFNERIGRVDPQAGELSELLRERLALPGIVAAATAAAVSAGIVLAAGLLIALITPDPSILGLVGVDASIVTEAFRQAVGTLLTGMYEPVGLFIADSRRLHPLLLLAIPLSALIWTTRWQIHRTDGAAPLARLAWASAVGLPFGLLMLAFAIIGGETDATRISPSAGGAFGLGVLWGVIGGLIGAATKVPLAELTARVPNTLHTVFKATLATLRPLAAVLVTCTAIGLVGWLVQVGADAGGVRVDRSAPTALIEEAAFAGEHGVHLTALAAGARFRADADGPLGLPFPVEDANDVPGRGGAFRIFSYDDALGAYVLLPALVLLMGLVALGALYAGFAAARAVGATSLGNGAAWGAITGPAWAIAMAILVVLAGGLFHGDADDASVFGVFLLGGALLGAGGGALAVSGQAAPSSESS